jgi:hypothetical protein
MGSDPDSDVDPEFEHDVVSAFGEAFNNVAQHGYGGAAPGALHVEVDWDDDKLVVTMIDDGRTFDPGTIVAPDLDEMPESGMGWFIMGRCMDEVDYRPGPPNVLRLVKLRKQRDGLLPPPPGGDGGPPSSAGATSREASQLQDGGRGSGIQPVFAASLRTGDPGGRPGAPSDHPGWRPGAPSDPDLPRRVALRGGSRRAASTSSMRIKAVVPDGRMGEASRRK